MRTTGTDSHGNPVALGGIDSDGELVGYIDGDGNCWTSRRERQVALNSGRIIDHYHRTGLVLPPEPLLDLGLDPAVIVEVYEQVGVSVALRARKRGRPAPMN